MSLETSLQKSVGYLSSAKALDDLDRDAYWPKWGSPWWHMLLLHEMGETQLIPQQTIEKFIAKLNQYPMKKFPAQSGRLPAGIDPYREVPCHCQLGTVYQVLYARGVNVDSQVPWLRPWFLQSQMDDGGLNCDEQAYVVKGETPSSMVGTIGPFEAILFCTDRSWTAEEIRFLKKGADFLSTRQLRIGSQTQYNANERESAKEWTDLCFPRFYYYDVLRGLNALLAWSEKSNNQLQFSEIQDVVSLLKSKFPDNQVVVERKAFDGAKSFFLADYGKWEKRLSNSFALLDEVSEIGKLNPYLSKQWSDCQLRLAKLSFL